MAMYLPKAYEYLDTLSMRLLNYPIDIKWKIDEYNLSGSRYSGKTTSITIEFAKMIAIAIKEQKKLAIYCFRYLTRQIKDLVEEIKIALDDLGIQYEFKNKDNTFRFFGDSFIVISGVYSPTGRINLKGLAKCYDYDLMIRWVEEANELKINDFQAIDFAIRGAKEFIKISSCNPDIIYQDHIKYLNNNCEFKEYDLKIYNQQLEIKNINGFRKLFHYTNWKVNPFLSIDIVKMLEELKIMDPIRAKPWYYGLPGSLAGSVFGNYLPNKRADLDFYIYEYTGGLDLGYSESPTAHPTFGVLIGYNNDYSRIQVLNEYYHNNQEQAHKSPYDLANDIIQFYKKLIIKYQINKRLIIYTDYGAGGLVMIDTLNRIIKDYQLESKLRFEPVDKTIWFIKDRVEAIQILLTNKWLGWNNNHCPNLTKTMSLMKYKEYKGQEAYKVDIIDLYDDGFDALCYAIMNRLANIINQIRNPLLKSKKLQERLGI